MATEQQSAGQITHTAADVYEEFFVPALLGAWAPRIVDAAGVHPGDRVLDVACGTGVVAREAQRRVGTTGEVVGLDRNDGMLAVARRLAPEIRWQAGDAHHLPFSDATFDAVLCQFGLMFFEDRPRAAAEMRRVVRPSGNLAVAVWGPVDASPGYLDLARLVEKLFGQRIASELYAPFSLGDAEDLRSIFAAAKIDEIEIRTVAGSARFPSLDAWLDTEIKGWTLAELIDDDQFAMLQQHARTALAHHVTVDGRVEFPIAAHLATTRS